MATNVAYDLSRFSDETPAQPRVRVANPRTAVRTEEDRRFLVRLVFLTVAVICLSVYTVYSNMMLTKVKSQITNKSAELVEIQSENIYLDYQIESMVTLHSAEEYAQNVLGLIKLDSAQIEYVNLEKENVIISEKPEISDRSAIAFLSTVIGWFNP